MITTFILLFETLYWVLTGGHCFEHLASPLAGLAWLFEILFEIIILGAVVFIIDIWRDL